MRRNGHFSTSMARKVVPVILIVVVVTAMAVLALSYWGREELPPRDVRKLRSAEEKLESELGNLRENGVPVDSIWIDDKIGALAVAFEDMEPEYIEPIRRIVGYDLPVLFRELEVKEVTVGKPPASILEICEAYNLLKERENRWIPADVDLEDNLLLIWFRDLTNEEMNYVRGIVGYDVPIKFKEREWVDRLYVGEPSSKSPGVLENALRELYKEQETNELISRAVSGSGVEEKAGLLSIELWELEDGYEPVQAIREAVGYDFPIELVLTHREHLREPTDFETIDKAMQWHIKMYPPSDVGYEISSRKENWAEGFVCLKAENDRVPFENVHLRKEKGLWHVDPGPWYLCVRSPSRDLEILGYEIRLSSVELPEWSKSRVVLESFTLAVKNLSRFPAFVSTVELRLENSTDNFRKSYPAGVIPIGRICIGIVGSGEIVEVGYQGGPAPPSSWQHENSTSLLLMDDLMGKTYKITITLKDGKDGEILAERTFVHTFGSRASVGDTITTFENFLEAFNDNDVKKMWNLLSANQREYMSLENFRKVLREPGEEVFGQRIGTLELERATLKDVEGAEATLAIEVVEHRTVLRPLDRRENIERPPRLVWENLDLKGSGEVRLRYEQGGWKIDMPVVIHPDPEKLVLALELEVEAPAEVEVGDGLALEFEIRNKSFLPISIYHAHTPARATLYKGENRIARFPQVIFDILTGATLGPFGSQTYEESIPPCYPGVLHEGEELHATFSEPGTYKIAPFAEFDAWWKVEMGHVEPHRIQAPPIETKVTGKPLIYLSTFDMRLLDFFNLRMGDLSGKFQIAGSKKNVEVKLRLCFSGQAVENLRIENLVLDTNLAFYGFWEKDVIPPLPPPPSQSITIRKGERVIPLKRTYDVSRLERPVFYVGFRINSIRASFSDGQVRVLPCGVNPLWDEEHKYPPSVVGMELKEKTEWHFYGVGTDLAIELDNRVYRQGSEIQARVTNLTNETLAFLGDRYDIYLQRWLEEENHWGPRTWVETEAISLPPGQSHTFSYLLEESPKHPFPPGRYRVVSHSSFAEFWIQSSQEGDAI